MKFYATIEDLEGEWRAGKVPSEIPSEQEAGHLSKKTRKITLLHVRDKRRELKTVGKNQENP